MRTRGGPFTRGRFSPVGLAVVVLTAAGGATAQTVTPTLTVSQTLTDNVRLTEDKRAESITRISPGIALDNRVGRWRGFLRYSLDAVLYAREASESSLQHSLRAAANAELIDRRLFFDANASISQQGISAFGQPVLDPGSLNPNSRQVLTYSLSPSLVGAIPGFAQYRARMGVAGSSASSQEYDSTTVSASLRLESDRSFGRVGWSAGADHQVSDFGAGRQTTTTSEDFALTYAVSSRLSLSANYGRQTSDISSGERQSRDTSGFGAVWRPDPDLSLSLRTSSEGAESASVQWTPTPRTSLAATYQRQIYGDTHRVSVEHRMRRLVFRFVDSRSAYTISSLATASLGTVFDLYFAQFASIEPDPVRREALVNAFLQANGLNPDLPVFGNFLTSAASLQRRQQLSVAWSGRLTTATLSASVGKAERLDTIAGVSDDLAGGGVVRTRGLSLAMSRRLSATTSANAVLSLQRNEGTQPVRETELRSLNVSWSTRIGRQSGLSLTARHVEFDSPTSPYDENAIIATFRMTF